MRAGAVELRLWLQQPTAWLILAVGVVLSFFAWRSLIGEVETQARSQFEAVVAQAREEIRTRLAGHTIVLSGLQGLFHAHPSVDRTAFGLYVASLSPTQRARLRTLSYAKAAPGPGRPLERLPVRYVEPSAGTEALLGMDLMSEPVRRASVVRSRDANMLVASAPFPMVTAPDGGPGISLRLPVFRPAPSGAGLDTLAARREAFAGIVTVTFLVRDLVGDIVSRHAAQGLRLEVLDAGELAHGRLIGTPMRMFESGGEPHAGGFEAVRGVDIGGRRWSLRFSAPEGAFRMAGNAYLPWLTLAGGLAITVLLAGLVGSLSMSGQRARRLARQMTDDLRRSQAELLEAHARTEQLIETLPNPVFFKGADGRYLGVNRAWESYFGIERGEIVGRTVQELYQHAPAVGEYLNDMDQALWRTPGTQVYETPITLPSGRRRDAIYYKATLTGPEGQVSGLVGTIVDITDRKQDEKLRAMEHAVTRVLAEAESLAEAIPRIVKIVCGTMGWRGGARWGHDAERRMLACHETWTIDTPEMRRFIAAATPLQAELGSGGGLVRRVYATGEPVWVAELAREPGLVRGALAAECGLRGGFAVPLLLGEEVLGVLEFYHDDERKPDPRLLSAVQAIGSQIGQYLVRKQAEEKLRFVATHDALTGLPNRVMFAQRLAHAIRQAQRHGRRLAVLFIDLDRFKLINDTLGHDSGDALLREVTRRLVQTVRESDTVGRLGGDEFVVLLEEVGEPMAVGGVAQKLIAALAERVVLAGREFHVTASIGVSTYPDDSSDVQTLLKNADIAMYRAKEQGRNTFQFYSAQLNVHTMERLTLESQLRRAVENGELLLHYQPQVELASGRITGVEALVRWRHPELGLLAPGRFIPIAEETGLIVPIGEWVAEAACAAQRGWRRRGFPPLRMSVNLSPRQFLHEHLLEDLRRLVSRSGVDPDSLELEITESMVMHDPEQAVKLIAGIGAMGMHVAIDDFGTGHSSLAYLKRFPVERLKIDRSFVADIPADPGDMAITKAIIGMAHSLGMRVVAEGVETATQHAFLLEHGCDEFQGYLFSRPLPEEEFLALLAQEMASLPTPGKL